MARRGLGRARVDPTFGTPQRGSARSIAEAYSSRYLTPSQQFGEVVVHAGHTEVRLATERLAQVAHSMGVPVAELHDGENEVVGFVERVQYFVLRDCNGSRAGHPPLDLNEPQPAGTGHAALDVVAELRELAVGGLEAQGALDLHHDAAGAGG